MGLGPFRFSIDTLAYTELARLRAWKWAEQELVGNYPALQFTGPEAETITLKGTTYPVFRIGGRLMIEGMAAAADQGKPLLLVSGLGLVFGFYVIEKIEENQFEFIDTGFAKKIEFNIALKRYSDLATAIAMMNTNPASIIGL
jgi:phage protein U